MAFEIAYRPSMLHNVKRYQWKKKKKKILEHVCNYNDRIIINITYKNWFLHKWWYSYKNILCSFFWKMPVCGACFTNLCVIWVEKNKEKYKEDHFLWRTNLICIYANPLLPNKLPFRPSFLKFINLWKKLFCRDGYRNPATSMMDKKSGISRRQPTAEGCQWLSVRAPS